MKEQIFKTILDLQTGVYSKDDIDVYNPEITGCGVSIWRLFDFFEDAPLVPLLRELVAEGRIKAINPDASGMVSFRAIQS